MRMIITLDGKKISKKAAYEMFGEKEMNQRIKGPKKPSSKIQMKKAAGGWEKGC